MRDEEKEHVILVAGKNIQLGVDLKDIEDSNLKKYMKKIAANAVLINLCDINHTIISNICDGDFDSVQDYMEEIIDRFSTCLTIIQMKGNYIGDLLSAEEIDQAIKYTIYEETVGRMFRDE